MLRGASLLRLRVGFLLIAMIVSIFAARLFQLQGVDAKAYVAKARAEGVVTVNLPATRGTITDRNGVPLADSVDGLMLVADPTLTGKHASAIATIIARRLDLDYFDVLKRLEKPYTHFQYIARRVPATKARAVVAAIDAKGFKGINTRRDPLRSYPGDDVAANVIGFMNEEGQAAEGAELMFDTTLAGKDGTATYEVGGGNRIPLGDNSTVPARSGHDVKLTIDRDVQWYTQRTLRNAVESVRGDSGSAVVMDTDTGELLALADYPTFDANAPSKSPDKDLGTRALRDVYEPGSVEKVLTTSALLDAGKITPQTKVVVPPELKSNDRVIHDDVEHGTLHLTMTGVLAKSSNIGTALAARQFTPEAAARLPLRVRARPPHGARRQRRVGRRALGPVHLGPGQPGQHRLRPGRRGQRRADGRGRQRGRQRRRLRLAEPHQGPRDHVRRPGRRLGHQHPPPGGQQARGRPGAPDDGDGHPGGRHRARRPRSPATASAARPAPRSGSARSAAATTAPARCRSSGSRRPTSPASSSTRWCRTPATAASAAPPPDRSSER